MPNERKATYTVAATKEPGPFQILGDYSREVYFTLDHLKLAPNEPVISFDVVWRDSCHPKFKSVPYVHRRETLVDKTGLMDKFVLLQEGLSFAGVPVKVIPSMLEMWKGKYETLNLKELMECVAAHGTKLIKSGRLIKIGNLSGHLSSGNFIMHSDSINTFINTIVCWEHLVFAVPHAFMAQLARCAPHLKDEILGFHGINLIGAVYYAAWLDYFPEDFDKLEEAVCSKSKWQAALWNAHTYLDRTPPDKFAKYVLNEKERLAFSKLETDFDRECAVAAGLLHTAADKQRQMRMRAMIRIFNECETEEKFLRAFEVAKSIFRLGKIFPSTVRQQKGEGVLLEPRIKLWLAEALGHHFMVVNGEKAVNAATKLMRGAAKENIFGLDWKNEPVLGRVLKQLSMEEKLEK